MKKFLIIILLLALCGCSSVINDQIKGEHTHTYSSEYSYDDTNHWHSSTCSHDVVSNKAKHNFDSGVVTKKATDEEEGIRTYTCQICGYTKTEKIAKLSAEEKNKSNIEVAEEIIANTYDSCAQVGTRLRVSEKYSYNRTIDLVQGANGLSGEFYYQDRNQEAFIKVTSEPLGYAFGLLEFFIQNGLPEQDFSEKCYFNPKTHVIGVNNEMEYTQIILISDDLLAINYGNYHMIIGEGDGHSFVLSYCYNWNVASDYFDTLEFEYYSEGISLLYNRATLNWKDEIDVVIDLLKDADDMTTIPFYAMKDLYIVDGVEQVARQHYDSKNPKHVVLPTYDDYSYTAPHIIQSYFMYEHYDKKISTPWVDANIEDGRLISVTGSGMILFEIPEEVVYIESLEHEPDTGPRDTTFFGLLFKNANVQLADTALEHVKHLDSIFIDSLDRNTEFEESFKKYFPNVHIYYQDEWTIKCDLVLPKIEIEVDDSDHQHIYTREIIDDEYLAQEANCVHGTCYYYVCKLCDKHGNQFYEVGEKGEHNYVVNEYATGSGDYTWYICTVCGLQYSHNNNDTEHHYVLIEAKPATCKEDGYYLYRCKITGDEKIESQEHFNHCFVNGGVCIRCHETLVTYEKHDFVLLNTTDSQIEMRCTLTDDELIQYVGFEDHSYSNGRCSQCGIPEHEHEFGSSFDVDGKTLHCCNICGYIESKETDEPSN